MPKKGLTVDEIMAILRDTPDRLAELTDGVTDAQLHAPPEPDAWSVNDVLAHLRACHDVLGGNMLRIIREDHPAWRAMSPRTWQGRSDYGGWHFGPAFAAFRAQRAELLEVLEPLPLEAWDRTATVKVPPAKIYEYSTMYYGDWMAGHERAHLGHIRRILHAVRTGS